MTTHKAILTFISRQFNLFTFYKPISLNTTRPMDVRMQDNLHEIFFSADHVLMARELVKGMSMDMRGIHYYRLVRGLTIATYSVIPA